MVSTTFVCVDCRVINGYGQPDDQPSPFDLLPRSDLTIGVSRASWKTTTGRIPAFAYAGDLSPRSHELGWVCAKKPGSILVLVKECRVCSGTGPARFQELVQGTIRLNIHPAGRLDGKRSTLYRCGQLQEGLAIFRTHLGDGRRTMDDSGGSRYPWRFDTQRQQWS